MNYEDVVSFDALYKGLQKCKRSASWKDSVAGYSANALKNTLRLKQDLSGGEYKIRPYNTFIVTDPKRREVMATNIRDRQFQRALCDGILYEDLTEHFIYDNCACQKGKGNDFALDRMEEHLHRFYRKHGTNGYILKCDIHHFFAETRHDVAKAAVRKRVKDDNVYAAVCDIIDSFGGDKGIGLGSQVSQLVQLSVLDDLDHYIKERLHIKHYIRYMDDFVLIHEDKAYLRKCLIQIEDKLRLIGLTLNSKTQIFPVGQVVEWLQWRFVLTDTGRVIKKPSKSKITRERKKLKRMRARGIPETYAAQSFQSWGAGIERRRAVRNNDLRRNGRIVNDTPNSGIVERMRLLFINLYGNDPYINENNIGNI